MSSGVWPSKYRHKLRWWSDFLIERLNIAPEPKVHIVSKPFNGFCEETEEGLVVTVGRGTASVEHLRYQNGVDSLMHELAHVMAPPGSGADHSDFWGLAFAALYREYEAVTRTEE